MVNITNEQMMNIKNAFFLNHKQVIIHIKLALPCCLEGTCM